MTILIHLKTYPPYVKTERKTSSQVLTVVLCPVGDEGSFFFLIILPHFPIFKTTMDMNDWTEKTLFYFFK